MRGRFYIARGGSGRHRERPRPGPEARQHSTGPGSPRSSRRVAQQNGRALSPLRGGTRQRPTTDHLPHRRPGPPRSLTRPRTPPTEERRTRGRALSPLDMKSQSATSTPSRPERELGQGGFPLPRTPTRTPPREGGLLSGPFRKALARATATGGRQRPERGSARTQERPRPSVSGTWTDDPERSRSTAEDRVTRTRPRGGTRGASGATASPTAGEAQPTPHRHPDEGGRQARDVSLTSRDHDNPSRTPPGRVERERLEVGPDSAPLPSTHHPRGGREARSPRTEREERSHSP